MRLTLTRVGTPLENWRVAEKELSAIEQRIVDLGDPNASSAEILRTLANLKRARERASRTTDQCWKLLLQDFARTCDDSPLPPQRGDGEEEMTASRTPNAQGVFLETVVRRMITNRADRRALRAELTAQAAECDKRRSESNASKAHRENERRLSDRIRAILFFLRTGALATGATEADIELCRLIQDQSPKRTNDGTDRSL